MKNNALLPAFLLARHACVSAAPEYRNIKAGLLAIALAMVTCTELLAQSRVLFYGPNDSTESEFLPASATFTVATETTWRAMTTSDFAQYDLIIIGEPMSGTGPTAVTLLAAYDTRNTWAASVRGRIVVSGMDPAFHASVDQPGAGTFITATLDWLTKGPVGKTALYVASDWGRRNLDFLSPFGVLNSTAFDADIITIASPGHQIMIGSTSGSLSGWNYSAHSYLGYSGSFSSLATGTHGVTGSVVIARDAPVLSITFQPANQIVDVGSTVTFAAAATGTAPLAYHWRFNGVDLYRADNATFVLPNAQWSNAGGYSVVVSNAAGSVTSRIALLTFPVHGFERITANPDRTVSLTFTGVVTTPFAPYYDLYPLDASTNLVNWSRLTMLQRTNSSSNALNYLDIDGTNFDKRFYRTHTNILITPLPKRSGPYAVGTVSRLLTDPSRSNRYNIPTNSSFMVTFWYPTEAKAGVLPEAYVESNATLYSYLNERNPSIVAKFVSHALPGLPLATNQSNYPVVIYSHGGGFRRQNTDKALELASHGYVVVAVDHIWTTASVFPSGQVVYGQTVICANPKACFQPSLDDVIMDFRFVLDELSRLNINDALFAGRLDLERLGAFGFSAGAVPVAEFCRIDARCKAVVLFDPGWILEAPTDLNQFGLQKPFLSMNSTRSDSRPAQPPSPPYTTNWLHGSLALFTNAINNAFWFQIEDSTHQSFQDRGSLISNQARAADPTPVSRAISQTIRACTLSFFDKYLKGQDDHLLDNPVAVYTNIINFRSK
jgi:dienelactone hydrolase